MPSRNPLAPIWTTYQVTKDCLKVTQRAVKNAQVRLLSGTDFVTAPPQTSAKRIQRSRLEWDEYVVLSLWVAFERSIVSFIQTKGRVILQEQPPSLADSLYAKYETEVEYWKTDDVLDLLKGDINGRLLGDAKNIKKYRDWIAHRNPRQSPPGIVTPYFAYRVLSDILIQVNSLQT